MSKHVWVEHKSYDECNGPPASCAICGLAEGALTTDCPGSNHSDLVDVIYKGAIDYVGGEWVVAASPHSPRSLDEKPDSAPFAFDDGEWQAGTLGYFVALLVDSRDEAVVFRVVGDSECDSQGRFTRKWEIVVAPQGLVVDTISASECVAIHKVLAALITEGIVQ